MLVNTSICICLFSNSIFYADLESKEEGAQDNLTAVDEEGAQDILTAVDEEGAAGYAGILDRGNELDYGTEGTCGAFIEADASRPSKCAFIEVDASRPAKCSQCVEWKVKYDELQKFSLKLTIHNANTDLKFADLLSTKTYENELLPDDVEKSSDGFFTARELKFLKCLPNERSSDSTFVRHCLEFIYKDNLSVFSNKTLFGTAEKKHFSDQGVVERVEGGKDPLTPPKVARIRSLFVGRISKANAGAVEYGERIKDSYLNRLIASSLQNICKKL